MRLSVDYAYVLCSHIAGVAILVSSLEDLSLLRHFTLGGIYDPRVTAMGHRPTTSPVVRNLAIRTEPLAISLLVRGTAGLALLLNPQANLLMTAAWTLAAATTLFGRWRNRYGGEDGSDQMLGIMTVTFAVCLVLSFGRGVREAGLYFVGAQACLAYATSGIAKLVSPQWRGGAAIQGVLSTRTCGIQSVAEIVQKSTPLALAMCWGTIVFESAFVSAPVLPRGALFVLFGVAALFHLSVGAVMGLNGFFWSFVATFPAIAFLNQTVTDHL